MSEAAIEFHEVKKSYGEKTVVDGLSFHVNAGECFGLLGPNGAGKTTTLRMLLGIASPDAGAIRLCGEPIPAPRAARAGARRRRAAVRQSRSRFHGARKPAGVRPLLRPERRAMPRGRAVAARIRAARKQGGRTRERAVGRHEAAPHAGARARQRSGRADHGRADHRPRSAGASSDLGAAALVAGARQDHSADHPLHGRGRAPVPSAVRDRRRPQDCRRRAERIDRLRDRLRRDRDFRSRSASRCATNWRRSSSAPRSAARRCSAM